MKKYIFGRRDSIHIIDLTQTVELIKIAMEKVLKLSRIEVKFYSYQLKNKHLKILHQLQKKQTNIMLIIDG